jgi:hypothetical protein
MVTSMHSVSWEGCRGVPWRPDFGSACGGSYQIERQPGEARQRTHRWRLWLACAFAHSHGVDPTITSPGPHSWPWWHAAG